MRRYLFVFGFLSQFTIGLSTDFNSAPFIVAGFGLIGVSSLSFWPLRCKPSTSLPLDES